MAFKLSRVARVLVAAGITLAASSSYAGLVLVTPTAFTGSGLGTVNTVLTIQNTGTETGSVAFNGTTDVTTGDAKTGVSQTQTRTLAEIGATTASALRIVFNAAEPAGDSITLTSLVLRIFNATGGVLFTSGAFTPQTFATTATGTGNSGFVFGLDAADAAAAQAAAFTGSFGTNRIGLTASATLAAGGNETFFVSDARVVTPPGGGSNNVPEPAPLGILALGLGLIYTMRRKQSV